MRYADKADHLQENQDVSWSPSTVTPTKSQPGVHAHVCKKQKTTETKELNDMTIQRFSISQHQERRHDDEWIEYENRLGRRNRETGETMKGRCGVCAGTRHQGWIRPERI
jgi:hypothetical protein